jgi:hypothetical protein
MNRGKLRGPEKKVAKWQENVNYGNIKAGFYCIWIIVL